MLEYRYRENQRIKKLLIKLEILRGVFDALPSFPILEENLRRESLLHSSVFSARIEGNPLTPAQINITTKNPRQDIKKREIFNLLRAYRQIATHDSRKALSIPFVLKFHDTVMNNLSVDAGHFRSEPWAVFNQAGIAIYVAPSPGEIKELMEEFVHTITTSHHPVPVIAAIAQFLFEKIHPFADGNGRVGRLLSAHLLHAGKYGMRGLIPFEEFIDGHREDYYEALGPTHNVTLFVEFFLHGFIIQSEIVLKKFQQAENSPADSLLPRRREILEILKDHPLCSFNFISRRFPAVNPKTLHYDLSKLQEGKYIKKIGKTRGSVYRIDKETILS